MKTLNAIFALAASFSLMACSTLVQKAIEKPRLEMASVGISNLTREGATVLFGIRIENPNAFSIDVDSLKYDIEIAGKRVSQGALEKPVEIAAKGKSLVEVPVPVLYAQVFSSIFDFLQTGMSTYRIKGEAEVGFLKIPFENAGEFSFKEQTELQR